MTENKKLKNNLSENSSQSSVPKMTVNLPDLPNAGEKTQITEMRADLKMSILKEELKEELKSNLLQMESVDKNVAIITEKLSEIGEKLEELEEEFKPIKTHVQQMKGAAKFIGLAAVIATLATTLSKVL